MTITIANENINKVFDRAVTVYNVWQATENDLAYCEYRGIEETLALVLGIELTEAEKMIRAHKMELEEKDSIFFEF